MSLIHPVPHRTTPSLTLIIFLHQQTQRGPHSLLYSVWAPWPLTKILNKTSCLHRHNTGFVQRTLRHKTPNTGVHTDDTRGGWMVGDPWCWRQLNKSSWCSRSFASKQEATCWQARSSELTARSLISTHHWTVCVPFFSDTHDQIF